MNPISHLFQEVFPERLLSLPHVPIEYCVPILRLLVELLNDMPANLLHPFLPLLHFK